MTALFLSISLCAGVFGVFAEEGKKPEITEALKSYDDMGGAPLKAFLEAQKPEVISGSKEARCKKYRDLLAKYPDCKLAPYVRYLLAESSEGNESIGNYSTICEKYPAAVFPVSDGKGKQGEKIAPLAALGLAWQYGKTDPARALTQLELTAGKYPKTRDAEEYSIAGSARIGMLNIYAGWKPKAEKLFPRDIIKAKILIEFLTSKDTSKKYEVEGSYFGETQPEAYLRLAQLERNAGNKQKAIKLFRIVIEKFPAVLCGVSHSAGSPYGLNAFMEILATMAEETLAMKECVRVEGSTTTKQIKGYAQLKIAEFYEKKKDFKRAKTQYEKAKEKYPDVKMPGEEENTIGDKAQAKIIQMREENEK